MLNSLENFENLFKRYRGGLVHFANSIVRSSTDAEEIVHDMFLAVWEKRDSLAFDDTLKNYLFTGVKNKCLNHIKKVRLPFSEMPDDFPVASGDANIADQIQGKEMEARIQILIDMLPNKCRMAFLLSRMQELSYKEIAMVMDITPKTVENQIGMALKFLKENLHVRKRENG